MSSASSRLVSSFMPVALLVLVASTAGVVAPIASARVAGGVSHVHRFGDGTFRVGKDIKSGTYRSGGGSGCYWARLKSFSGDTAAIIANANPAGPTLVTIGSKDKGFESQSCGTWTSNLARITKSKTRFGQGTYIVGTDVTPGTYRARGGSGCYWARLKSFSGDTGAIIANANPSGATIVNIQRADRGFESQSCGTWSRL